jgi:hypothetical protein
VRRVPQPKLPHRHLIAFHGALKGDLVGLHPVYNLVTGFRLRVAARLQKPSATRPSERRDKHLHIVKKLYG